MNTPSLRPAKVDWGKLKIGEKPPETEYSVSIPETAEERIKMAKGLTERY